MSCSNKVMPKNTNVMHNKPAHLTYVSFSPCQDKKMAPHASSDVIRVSKKKKNKIQVFLM